MRVAERGVTLKKKEERMPCAALLTTSIMVTVLWPCSSVPPPQSLKPQTNFNRDSLRVQWGVSTGVTCSSVGPAPPSSV
jgi:hypothetical protein